MKRPILSIIIIFLIIFLLSYFVLLDKYNTLRLKKFDLEQKTKNFESLKEYFVKLSLMDEELDKHENEMQKIHSALPTESNVPSVFKFIQKITLENNLTLEQLSVTSTRGSKTSQPVIDDSGIKKIPFSLTVSGSYSDFKNFLSVLEKSARIIELEGMSFSYAETANPAKITFNLKMRVHSY